VATKLADAEGGEVDEYLESWGRRLRARNRSEKTIRGYGETVQLFLQFLRCHDMPTAVGDVKREHVEAFIADQLARWKPTTALTRHQALRQFFLYLVDEGELTDSPMARMKPPSIPDVPVPIVTDNDLRRLLKACEGTDFESRRDMAILRLFIDTGCRLAEITDLAVEDVILEAEVINVVGKGKRPRSAPYGPKTSSALDLRWRFCVCSSPSAKAPSPVALPSPVARSERWPNHQRRRADTQAALRDGGYRSAASSSVPTHCRPCVARLWRRRDRRNETFRMEESRHVEQVRCFQR
jgi:site-specific recombinase XerC